MIQYLTTDKKTISYTGSYNSWVMDVGMGGGISSPWQIKKFAGKLKQIAAIMLGVPVEKFEDREFKNSKLGAEWGHPYPKLRVEDHTVLYHPTVREFLQQLGTEAIRNGLHQNAWVNALMSEYKDLRWVSKAAWDFETTGRFDPKDDLPIYPSWVITDVRFGNEAQAIKDRGGVVWTINRPGYKGTGHESETALKNWPFDATIDNNDDLDHLETVVAVTLDLQGFL